MPKINYLVSMQYCGGCLKRLGLAAALLLLSGCGVTGQYDTLRIETMDDIQRAMIDSSNVNESLNKEVIEQPSEDILQSLVPGLTLSDETLQIVEERFDFVVSDAMNAREFFTLLTEGTDYSVAVHPDIKGTISDLDLKNVTLSEALEHVSVLYGFEVNRSGDVFQILPGGMQTRIFKINYLNVTRKGFSNMQITSTGIVDGSNSGGNNGRNGNNSGLGGSNSGAGSFGGNGNNSQGGNGNNGNSSNSGGASINTTSEADYWEGLEEIIESIVGMGATSSNGLLGGLSSGDQRSVVVAPHTGMIVVRAYPDELKQVAAFLQASQSILQRQVVLEAKILEVDLKESFQSGIDLAALGTINGNEVGAGFSFTGEPLDSIGSAFAMTYSSSNFNAVIALLETQGNVQVVSSPRISTINNQKAVFKVGDESFYLTSANTTSFGSGDEATTNQNIDLQPFFSGIALDVTPQISEEGDIILHIHPILSSVQEEIKVINGREYPLANSVTRESDSIARAKNGEVIVISGLMQNRSIGASATIPGVGNIPLVGDVLSQRQQETVKTELVILLRAIVDEDNDVMQDIIEEHSEHFDALRQQMLDPYYR